MNWPGTLLTFSADTLDALANRIRVCRAGNQRIGQNTIIAIAGGSSTGKTTQVAAGLREQLGPDCQLIGQDHFQLGRDYDLTLDPVYRWDGLGNYGLPESAALLSSLRRGQSVEMPVYSFADGRRTGVQLVTPTPIVLFEGLYAGFGDLRKVADGLVYVEAPLYARLLRRLFRNTFERYRADPSLSLSSMLSGGVLPAHRDLVRQQRATADVIVQMPYAFADTISRFGLLAIDRPYTLDKVRFSFPFGNGSDWRVETGLPTAGDAQTLFVSLFHEGILYFSFPIDEDSVRRLADLDLKAC